MARASFEKARNARNVTIWKGLRLRDESAPNSAYVGGCYDGTGDPDDPSSYTSPN